MTSLLNNENTYETQLNSNSDSNTDTDTSSDSDIRDNYNKMVIERQKIFTQTNKNMNQKYEQYVQDSDLEESDSTYSKTSEDSQDLFTSEIDYSKPVQIDDINNIHLPSDNLDYIHNDDNHLAMKLFEKKEIYKEYFIVLENANQDANGVFVTIDPSGYKNAFVLNRSFDNVDNVELIEVIIKDLPGNSYNTDPSGTPFILLEIDEFSQHYYSNNNNISNTFRTLSYYQKINNDRFLLFTDLDNGIKTYLNPRKTISSFTLRFKKPNGTDFLFSNSSISEPVYWIKLKLTCLERKLKTLLS